MEVWMTMTITIIGSIVATSGFWTFIQRRLDKKDVQCEMLIGLGHDRIIYLGMCYIDRGWLTQAEYENIEDYLYKPYSKMGGNGTAEKIIQQVRDLPIRNQTVEDNRQYCKDHQRMMEKIGGLHVD